MGGGGDEDWEKVQEQKHPGMREMFYSCKMGYREFAFIKTDPTNTRYLVFTLRKYFDLKTKRPLCYVSRMKEITENMLNRTS